MEFHVQASSIIFLWLCHIPLVTFHIACILKINKSFNELLEPDQYQNIEPPIILLRNAHFKAYQVRFFLFVPWKYWNNFLGLALKPKSVLLKIFPNSIYMAKFLILLLSHISCKSHQLLTPAVRQPCTFVRKNKNHTSLSCTLSMNILGTQRAKKRSLQDSHPVKPAFTTMAFRDRMWQKHDRPQKNDRPQTSKHMIICNLLYYAKMHYIDIISVSISTIIL